MTSHNSMERRSFLKGALASGALVAGSALAGCAPSDKKEGGAGNAGDATDSGTQTAESSQREWSFEIPPEPIAEDAIVETVEADVIVVGAGTSGLMTAVSAAEEGLDVIVVSASTKPVARGGSNNAVYCKAMEREGFERLTPFMFQKEIFYAGNQVDEAKWYKHYNNSETAMNWVIDLMENAGYRVKVEKGTPGSPTSLYYETCSVGWDYGEGMEPDPDIPSGTGMMQPLLVRELARRLTEDLNGRIDFQNKGEQLVREADNTGRVTAIICSRTDGSYAKYVGRRAIVLATGDFSANRDMMYRFAPNYAPYIDDAVYDSEPNYDAGFQYGGLYKGDGQRMGLWVGAGWQKIFPNCVMGGFWSPGPHNLYSNFLGLLVNVKGERFMNEDCLWPCASMNNFGQPNKTSFALWGQDYASQVPLSGSWNNDSMFQGDDATRVATIIESWDADVKTGAIAKGDTMESVIEQLGLPPETIDTVNRYNELCLAGEDTDFYKDPSCLLPFGDGPYYGQSNGGLIGFLTVLGGLATDPQMRVCDKEDNPIPGLYNVGTMVGDMYATNYSFMVEGANYGANCITFGYLTGKHIAENE
ncbi:FAD-binding protein [Adlercreutzia mucosicola]|nr:FAD-binding protein [Adlercreutzia mucosicola]